MEGCKLLNQNRKSYYESDIRHSGKSSAILFGAA